MEQEEIDVKRMLTSFDVEVRKYSTLAEKLHQLSDSFQTKNRLYEGLKEAKKRGGSHNIPSFKFVNPNQSARWEDLQIHRDYLDGFYDLAIKQVIFEIREIKKQIDYLLQVQK